MNLNELDIKFRELVFIIMFVVSVVSGSVALYYSNTISQQKTQTELSKINNTLKTQNTEIKSIKKDVTKVKLALIKNDIIEIDDLMTLPENWTIDYTRNDTIPKQKKGICIGEDTYVKSSDWNIE